MKIFYLKQFIKPTTFLKSFFLIALVVVGCKSWGQTPTAQNLPYTQDFGTSTFTTMPAGTGVFQGGSNFTTQSSAEGSTPTTAATLTTATATATTGGCYGYATASNARVYIQQSSNATNGTNQLWAAVNTGTATSLNLSYQLELINGGVTTQDYGIELQYRNATSGAWTSITGSVITFGAVTTYSTTTLNYTITGLTVSSVCQIRWIVWRPNGSGNSKGIGIDNISITAAVGPKYWDATAGVGNGTGGSSTWGTTFSTTSTGDAALTTTASTDDVIFQGTNTPNVVNFAASQTVKSTTVNTADYSITTSGVGTYTYTSTNGIILNTNSITSAPVAGADLTIPNVISGTNGAANTTLTKNGAGVLFFTGAANTFTGKVLINNGFINTAGESRFGANPTTFTPDQITLNGGGIQSSTANINFSSNRGITIGASDGTFDVSNGQSITLSNAVTGIGTLIKSNAGKLIFTVASNYSGATKINAGIVQINSANLLPTASYLYLNGGTFSTGATVGFDQTLGVLNLLASSAIALGTAVHTLTFTGVASAWAVSPATLTITGWVGTAGANGTAGKIFVPNATYLSASQLAQISFTTFTTGAAIIANGANWEIVPAVPTGCTPPAITAQPTNQSVGAPATATFILTATNAVGYQWQVNAGSGFADIPGATSNSYTTPATSTSNNGYIYKCIVTGATGCGNITSSSVTLTVTSTPCVFANFDAATTIPSGWAGSSTNDVSSAHYQSASNCRALASIKDLITPVANNPISIAFYVDASSSGGQIGTLEYSTVGQSGPWTTIGTFTATTAGANITFPLTSSPNLSTTANVYFRISSAANTIYIDDVSIYCGSGACTLPTTIGSFIPLNGPEGTMVTITGSGFVPTSSVKFGTIASTAVTYINSTTLTAKVPAGVGATSAVSTSNAAGCYSNGFGAFTLINATGSCGYTDLIISEIYDANSGNNHYIEIYNGTSNTINLDAPDYELSVQNNPSGVITTWDISGTISPGQVIVYYGGSNGGLATGTQSNAGSGYNDGFDEVRLLKGGVILDRVIGLDELGYTIRRTGVITGPNSTYTTSEWTTNSNESTADIGLYTPASTSLSITSNPADQTCNFSMNVVGAGIPTNYQWKFYNTTTNTWDNLNNGIATALAPAVVAGATSATLNITGDIASLYKYQFYCELGKAGCTKASNAAQFNYSTKAYYRSNVTTGYWTTPGSWLMSDDDITYVATCTYPISVNSDFVKIVSGNKIILNTNSYIFNEDKLDIQIGGELEIGTSAQIQFQNNQAGADLLVNGTLTDRSTSGNGTYFASGATWAYGATGTLVKTNTASINAYQVSYDGGASTMPANANWIFRYNGDGNVTVATTGAYYPNLTYESTSGFHDATGATEKFTGAAGGFATIKGNFDVGGSGTGTVTIYNENTNTQPMLINGNLIIRAGSNLNNGAATSGTGFEVKGNISMNGTLNVNTSNSGLLLLSGTTNTQVLSGDNATPDNMNIQNCTMTNTIGIKENKDFNIFGTHTFGANAKLDFGTGVVSIKSTATKTANVAAIPTTADITYTGAGRFSIERYLFLPTIQKAWRFLATPIEIASAPSIFNSWQEGTTATTSTGYGTQITGPGGSAVGMDLVSPRASMKKLNTTTNNFDDITNTSATIANTEGYFVYIRGDRSAAQYGPFGTTTLRIKGKMLIGDQTGVGYTVGASGFLSVGNPYPSQIDFKAMANGNSNISHSFYVWNPNSVGSYNAGAYEVYVQDIAPPYDYKLGGTGAVKNTIESGQAFIIQSITNGGITITEANKTVGSNLVSRVGTDQQSRAGIAVSTLEVNLMTKDATGINYKADNIVLNFDDNLSNEIDNQDVRKVLNAVDNIAILSSSQKLVVERRKPLAETDTIKINISNTRVAAYQFLIDPSLLNNTGLEAFLQDKFLQTTTPISLVDSTIINFAVTTDAASKAADRFMIVFKQAPTASFTTIAAIRNIDNSITLNWGVANEKNVVIYTLQQSNDGANFTDLHTQMPNANNGTTQTYTKLHDSANKANNWYRIKVINTNTTIKYSNVAMVAAVKENTINTIPNISIEPNIVVNGNINLRIKNKVKGIYIARVYNAAGQLLKTKNIELQNSNQLQLIQSSNIAKGKYYIVVEDEKRYKTILNFIVN